MEADEVTIFPTRGFFKTTVKIRIPVPLYERICQDGMRACRRRRIIY
jgi:hypothetical protein